MSATAPAVTPAAPVGLKVDYVLQLFMQLAALPFTVLNRDDQILKRFDSDRDQSNVLKTDAELLARLASQVRAERLCLVTAERPVVYGGVLCLDGVVLLIGPVLITPRPDPHFTQLYALKHRAAHVVLTPGEPEQLAAVLLLIYGSLYGVTVDLNAFLQRYFLHPAVLESSKLSLERRIAGIDRRPHEPLGWENSIRAAIAQGDPAALDRALKSPYAAMRGQVGKSPLRHAKNLSIVDVVIATRAGIDGGVDVEEMYTTADTFILEIENCLYPVEARSLARACAVRCAERVRVCQAEREARPMAPTVRKISAYIEGHLGETLSAARLAARFGISESYLCRLFRRDQGVTVGAFVAGRRVAAAKKLLCDQRRQISVIAADLAFCSVSHFSTVFRRLTGVSPLTYRRRHALRAVDG